MLGPVAFHGVSRVVAPRWRVETTKARGIGGEMKRRRMTPGEIHVHLGVSVLAPPVVAALSVVIGIAAR